jgi:hypothetical protein
MRKVNQRKVTAPRLKTIVKASIDEDGIIWMNAYEVNELTKWDGRKLDWLRERGKLTYRKEGNRIEYDVSTVLRIFQIEKQFQ